MAEGLFKDGIAAGRLSPAQYADNFADLHPPLDRHEALRRGRPLLFLLRRALHERLPDLDRYPAVHPRDLDRQSARRRRNHLRAEHPRRHVRPRLPDRDSCAKKPACARRPRASRSRSACCSATPPTSRWQQDAQFFKRGAADRQARRRRRRRPGRPRLRAPAVDARPRRRRSSTRGQKPAASTNTASPSYKTPDGFAQAEVDYVTAIGGITIENGKALGARLCARRPDRRTTTRCSSASALAASMRCAPKARTADGVDNAIDFIAELRQASDLAALPIGRRVVVIGGGMTAVDAAVQSKLLGAEEVTMVYRRGKEQMNASGVRAGPRRRQGRHHPPLAGAEARADRRRQGHRHRARTTWRSIDGTLQPHRRDHDHRLRPGVQGHRPDARHRRRGRRSLAGGKIEVDAEGRTSHGQSLGRRRLRHRRRRPHRHRRRRRPRRGRKHQPVPDGGAERDEFTTASIRFVDGCRQSAGVGACGLHATATRHHAPAVARAASRDGCRVRAQQSPPARAPIDACRDNRRRVLRFDKPGRDREVCVSTSEAISIAVVR